jgi:hypothetical protein
MNDETEKMGPLEIITPQTPAQTFGQFLMNALADPNIPADKLEVIGRLRKEVLAEQAEEAFNFAYSKMMLDMPQIEKRGRVELITKAGVELGRYDFARWDDIDKHIRPILVKHGFALGFHTEPAQGGVAILVVAELSYGGHTKRSVMPLPPDAGPGRNSLQAVGGAQTYGMRYTATALLNIVRKGEDDDATSLREQKVDAEQVKQLEKLLSETRTDKQRILEFCGVTELTEMSRSDFLRFQRTLTIKKNRANNAHT